MARYFPKFITMLTLAAGVLSGVAVFQIKFKVQEKAKEVEMLAEEILEHREAIRVLRAEWSYLTTPSALQDKSLKFLALMPPTAEQIVASPTSIPYRPEGAKAEEGKPILLPQPKKSPKSKAKKSEYGT